MQDLVNTANELGASIETFINEAAEVRSGILTWLANHERIPEDSLASILQLRIMLQTVDGNDRKLTQAYNLVADQTAFKMSGLKQTAEQLNYGPIAEGGWKIAVGTISRRGFPHYLDEISRHVSMLDGKLRDADEAIKNWNTNKVGDRAAGADVRLALDGVSLQAQALQGFVQTGMMIIISAADGQKADA